MSNPVYRILPGRRIYSAAWSAGSGFLLGYFFLHPISMVIFHFLDPVYAHTPYAHSLPHIWSPLLHSFQPEMIPMGLLFALVGSSIMMTTGYFRNIIENQRDDLTIELDKNERYRLQLEQQTEVLKKQNRILVELEEENRRATQFLVHDLKTNINCIIGFTELSLEKISNPSNIRDTLLEILARIHRQAKYIAETINNLLGLTRLRKSQSIQKSFHSIQSLFDRVLKDFPLPNQKERIHIGEEHKKLSTVYCDFHLIGRTISNLASNAFKHNSPETHIQIDAYNSPDNASIIFTCQDNGKGIPSDILPSLYHEYHYGHTASDSESTGLGLAFCKLSVEAHGGRIWCESQENVGAKFYFSIPKEKE
ncbi:MAG: HAMP domain-containing sensor histidine kinase [Candidatus Omnitrophota bacterium]